MTDVTPAEHVSPLYRLHVPGERLGWTFRDRHLFRRRFVEPYPQPAPIPLNIVTVARLAQTRTGSRIGIAVGVGVGIAALLACCGAFGSLAESGTAGTGSGVPLGAVFYTLAGVAFVGGLVAVVIVLVHRVRAVAALQAAQAAQAAAHQVACQVWEARRVAHYQAEQSRVDAIAEWGAAQPAPGTRRVDIVGGNIWGWEAVLTVFGASLLRTRGALTVVDFSGEAACRELIRSAEETRVSMTVHRLPTDLPSTDLLSGLTDQALVDTLIEAMHGDSTGSGNRAERAQDDRILAALVSALGAPVTVARIVAALRVLMDEPGGHDALSAADRQRITDELFADEFKRQVQPNLRRIESYLHQLNGLSTAAVDAPATLLTCLVEETEGHSARRELLKDLILQWLIRQISAQTTGLRSLVLVGVDDLSHRHLERLSDLCERRDIRLVLFYRHLRDEAVKALGGGSVGFMRLANHEEARQAAEFIGRQHKFVLSQLTRTLGGNETHSVADQVGSGEHRGGGWSAGGYHSNWGVTRNWSQTVTRADGTNWSDAAAAQRVYEYSVEPRTLQDLPDYALLLVKGHGQTAVLEPVDVNPGIVVLPRVTMQPLDNIPLPDPAVAEIPLTGSPTQLALGAPTRLGMPGPMPGQAATGVLPGWGTGQQFPGR